MPRLNDRIFNIKVNFYAISTADYDNHIIVSNTRIEHSERNFL